MIILLPLFNANGFCRQEEIKQLIAKGNRCMCLVFFPVPAKRLLIIG